MHYHFSDWPKASSEFSKSAPGYIRTMSRMLMVMGNHVWLQCMISKHNDVKFARFALFDDSYIFTCSEISSTLFMGMC